MNESNVKWEEKVLQASSASSSTDLQFAIYVEHYKSFCEFLLYPLLLLLRLLRPLSLIIFSLPSFCFHMVPLILSGMRWVSLPTNFICVARRPKNHFFFVLLFFWWYRKRKGTRENEKKSQQQQQQQHAHETRKKI